MTDFTLYVGDALDAMHNMEDESVDLIVTSPPYADQRKSTYGGVKPDEYVAWFHEYTAEMFRILKPEGSLILNIKEKVVNGQRHTYVLKTVLDMIDMGWLWTEEYIWHKTTTTPGKWPNRFRDLWEHCYHFTKQKQFVMHQDEVKVPIGDWAKTRLAKLSENDKNRQASATGSGYGRNMSSWVGKETVYPGNVLHGSSETQNRKHSAVYPVWLPEWFIKLFSTAGDTVFDPFMGSGTTAIAALNVGRSPVGVELLKDYADIAVDRVRADHTDAVIDVQDIRGVGNI